MEYLLVWFAAVSFCGFVLTLYDKSAAIAQRRRIPEKVLISVGAAGGALVMFITMQLIRHKTRHKKFMLGLPVILCVHIVAVGLLVYFGVF